MSDPLRIGVVGAGAVAQVAHLGVLRRLDAVEAVGVCDIDVAKARALAERFAIPEVYDDIEDLLRYSHPDAVVVCTPNHLHEVHTVAALSAGAHVLCERPLALSAEGVQRVAEARHAADRAVMVGMNHRFRPDVEVVRRFLTSGALGEITGVRAGWYIFRPVGQPVGWRTRRDESGGGAMLDLGLPLVDLALWLTGDSVPTRVSAGFSSMPGVRSVESGGCALLRCPDGLSIFVDVSWRHVGPQEKFWFEIYGTEGSAGLGPAVIFREVDGTPTNVTPVGTVEHEDPFSASYRHEWIHFAAVVRGDAPTPQLEDQLILQRAMEAIRRSADQGCDVEL